METFDPRECNYNVWCDAYGDVHYVEDMSDDYIRACSATIKTKSRNACKRGDDPPISVEDITSPEWCAWFGEGYLKSFRDELKKRKEQDIDI